MVLRPHEIYTCPMASLADDGSADDGSATEPETEVECSQDTINNTYNSQSAHAAEAKRGGGLVDTR